MADAAEARNWYAERSPLAARGFLLELQAAVAAVTEAPERSPKHRHGCRRYVFPFAQLFGRVLAAELKSR